VVEAVICLIKAWSAFSKMLRWKKFLLEVTILFLKLLADLYEGDLPDDELYSEP
jgi:hypothetical protein